MSKKLWQAQNVPALNPIIEDYTVGKDYNYDQKLIMYDIQASIAHAEMLTRIGILSHGECKQLTTALKQLLKLWRQGDFVISKKQEDGHTAIEAYLTEVCGDVGKKIHTGRSRNDQALVMMRLYLKNSLASVQKLLIELVEAYKIAEASIGNNPMPGYTHMQKAMPSTVGTWLNAYSASFNDLYELVCATAQVIDQNPLGSAAGFGSALNLDREYITKALGFSKTQDNPMHCGLSRGLFELLCIQALSPIMVLAGKFAQDMLLFTTQEFEFFSLPKNFTTGSSIMPHKQNYDLFEIMRGHSHAFPGYSTQLQAITNGTGSGYNRDLQLTKGICVEAIDIATSTLQVLITALPEMHVNKAALKNAMSDELMSVAKIDKLVQQGVPFRDAYKQVKQMYLDA